MPNCKSNAFEFITKILHFLKGAKDSTHYLNFYDLLSSIIQQMIHSNHSFFLIVGFFKPHFEAIHLLVERVESKGISGYLRMKGFMIQHIPILHTW